MLEGASTIQLATRTPEGAPVLRVLDSAVVGDLIVFHGAVAGEKAQCVGQPAVVSVHEDVASIPSYFIDPQMACPATTYYRSVQAHGTIVELSEPAEKAEALQAFMEHQQPEGGYRPIEAADPLYQLELKRVRVFGVRVERVDAKVSIGQDRPAERTRRIAEGLWRRGDPGDTRALRVVLDASPGATPDYLAAAGGLRFVTHPWANELEQVPALLSREYWRQDEGLADIRTSHERSTAWLGALDGERLVGVARALSDWVSRATIYDVVVAADVRGRGVGTRLVELLLAHPALRGCHRVVLSTRDQERFYERFGFAVVAESSGREGTESELARSDTARSGRSVTMARLANGPLTT